MEKILLDNVQIGSMNANGKFFMSPMVVGTEIFFQILESGNSSSGQKTKIAGYEIFQDGKVELFDYDKKGYIVNSFTEDYLKCLNKLNHDSKTLIKKCETKSRRPIGEVSPKIYDLMLKIDKTGLFLPPVTGFKIYGFGNIYGHERLLNEFGKTSKFKSIEVNTPNIPTISSRRTTYTIMSISTEYKEYLLNLMSGIEKILKQYSK